MGKLKISKRSLRQIIEEELSSAVNRRLNEVEEIRFTTLDPEDEDHIRDLFLPLPDDMDMPDELGGGAPDVTVDQSLAGPGRRTGVIDVKFPPTDTTAGFMDSEARQIHRQVLDYLQDRTGGRARGSIHPEDGFARYFIEPRTTSETTDGDRPDLTEASPFDDFASELDPVDHDPYEGKEDWMNTTALLRSLLEEFLDEASEAQHRAPGADAENGLLRVIGLVDRALDALDQV